MHSEREMFVLFLARDIFGDDKSFLQKPLLEIATWRWDGRYHKHFWTRNIARGRFMTPYTCADVLFSPDEMWLSSWTPSEWRYSWTLINVELDSVQWKTEVYKRHFPEEIAFDSTGNRIVVGAYQDPYRAGGLMADKRSHAFVFSINDGGRLLHSELIRDWGAKHAKSFSVGFIGAIPVVVEPHLAFSQRNGRET